MKKVSKNWDCSKTKSKGYKRTESCKAMGPANTKGVQKTPGDGKRG